MHIIRNDQYSIEELRSILCYFSAVVVGPGPGSPTNDKDIGVVKYLWKLNEEDILPVFGVCLGLQSLVVEFGGRIRRLNVVKHGQISRVNHDGRGIFEGVGKVEAVRYHSLHVEMPLSDDLEALAWADDGKENGKVVMAARHRTKPFWAVQYHPESVRTQGGGEGVLQNFWCLATEWTSNHHRKVRIWTQAMQSAVSPWPITSQSSHGISPSTTSMPVTSRTLDTPHFSLTSLCEALGVGDETSDFVLLESAARPGRFSIIGCPSSLSIKLTFRVGDPCVRLETVQGKVTLEHLESQDIWDWLSSFMRSRRACGGKSEVPFWGGLIGFLSYELGVNSLGADVSPRSSSPKTQSHPDVNLAFVGRSIVHDTSTHRTHVQTILPNDEKWVEETSALVSSLEQASPTVGPLPRVGQQIPRSAVPSVVLPPKETYIERIKEAKEYLYSGDSYELCLTAPTRISVPKFPRNGCTSSSWELYKILRRRNPAPHSGYIRLHPSTLVSSSPERFLSYSRPPDSVCQLRPIKGTVRKGPGVTRAVAETQLAGSDKEVAENLMIVDLIRHDLHGVVGEDVQTKQFCVVEEYETVWQLVSVIEGRAAQTLNSADDTCVGWEVLQRSLPPGMSNTCGDRTFGLRLSRKYDGSPEETQR